jgi:hypothetical protein
MNSRYNSFFSGLGCLALLAALSACGGSGAMTPPPDTGVPCAYFVTAGNDFYGKPFNGATTQPLVPSEPVANGFYFTTCRGTFVSGTKTVARTLSFFFNTDSLKVGDRVYTRVNYQELDPTVPCPSATCILPIWTEEPDSSYVKILSADTDKRSSASGNISIRGDITVTL